LTSKLPSTISIICIYAHACITHSYLHVMDSQCRVYIDICSFDIICTYVYIYTNTGFVYLHT
jgi:hypothetical protein